MKNTNLQFYIKAKPISIVLLILVSAVLHTNAQQSMSNDSQCPFRNPLSSFGLEVGTRTWENIDKHMNTKLKLYKDSIRIEEMYNKYEYDYPKPSRKRPFEIVTYLTECPWNKDVKLLHIGVQGREQKSTDEAVKILAQNLDVYVEFNPAYVDAYRLVGYDGRKKWSTRKGGQPVNAQNVKENFRVTALYEITPATNNYASVEERVLYQKRIDKLIENHELANVRLKYRAKEYLKMWEIKEVVNYRSQPLFHKDIPEYVRHSAAMCQLGLILKDSDYKNKASFENVTEILETLDPDQYESAGMISLVKALQK